MPETSDGKPRLGRRLLAGHLAAGCSLALLAGCETPPSDILPSLTFDSAPPLPLDVAELIIDDLTADGPNRGTLSADPLPGEPATSELNEPVPAVVTRWARQRFFAVGQSGTARLVIEQAYLRRELLARSQGLRGIVTIDQAERYSTGLAVRMVLNDPGTAREGFAWASVARSVSIAEDATLSERQDRLFTMLERSINELDTALVAEMRQKVSSFVLR